MIKVRFNNMEAGEIDEGALPLNCGTYSFVPYRSVAHLNLVTNINQNGVATEIMLTNGCNQTVLCKAITERSITIE